MGRMTDPDDKTTNTPIWLTTTEVAAQLRCSQLTVRRYVQQGRLPAKQFGRRLRIPAEAVAGLIK